MMSDSPSGVYVAASIVRHFSAVVEIEWSFPWALNRYSSCDCAWTHSASDSSNTYGWEPRQSGYPSGGAEAGLGSLDDDSL